VHDTPNLGFHQTNNGNAAESTYEKLRMGGIRGDIWTKDKSANKEMKQLYAKLV
jgi:hypothetical protein